MAYNENVLGQLLNGYVSSPGVISSSDTLLTAIEKLNGNASALITGVSAVENLDGTLIISPSGGTVIASLNLGHSNTWTGVQSFSAGDLVLLSGTSLKAPLTFTPSGSTLLTAPIAGSMEIDANGLLYYTNFSTSRGKVDTEHFVVLVSPFTLTSQTTPQQLFNATPNGALTVNSSTSYFFECDFNISSLSSSSGTFGFGFGGTATLNSQAWKCFAFKAAFAGLGNTVYFTFNTATSAALTASNLVTTGVAKIYGIIRVNAGGTLIPQVSLSVANAAVIGTNSFFKIWPVGTNVITNLGAWT